MRANSDRRCAPAAWSLIGASIVLLVNWAYKADSPTSRCIHAWEPGDRAAGDGVLQRFQWGMAYIQKTQHKGVFPEWGCPPQFEIGMRIVPWNDTREIGQLCEPWIARSAVTMLLFLLLPGTAKALEWSTGSSTQWLLHGHVRHLISIEDSEFWADLQKTRMADIFDPDFLKEHWELHIVTPEIWEEQLPIDRSWVPGDLYHEYAAVSFLNSSHDGTFDFISIDGAARPACFPRALQLLKPHGGVLDNADDAVAQGAKGAHLVPKRWPKYEGVARKGGSGALDRTIIWVSCMRGRC